MTHAANSGFNYGGDGLVIETVREKLYGTKPNSISAFFIVNCGDTLTQIAFFSLSLQVN